MMAMGWRDIQTRAVNYLSASFESIWQVIDESQLNLYGTTTPL